MRTTKNRSDSNLLAQIEHFEQSYHDLKSRLYAVSKLFENRLVKSAIDEISDGEYQDNVEEYFKSAERWASFGLSKKEIENKFLDMGLDSEKIELILAFVKLMGVEISDEER